MKNGYLMMSIIEILIEYVSLLQEGEHTAEVRKQLLLEQREELIQKIDELQQMLGYLNGKIEKYDSLLMEKEKEINHTK